jgi:hypothetical protein
VTDTRFEHILQHLLASRFSDVAGARLSATVPISERLLNELIALLLPRAGAVREVAVRPQAGNRLAVRVKMARPAFLPPISLTLFIDRQPELPSSPLVVFRVASVPGLISVAGAALSFADVLPPGVRLEGDRLIVDLAALLERHGHRALLDYAERLRITTDDGTLVLDVAGRV